MSNTEKTMGIKKNPLSCSFWTNSRNWLICRPIDEALLYLAGYDVRFWFFVHDVSQLQLHYRNSWQTFFANTGTQCFFGVSDVATTNLVSEMAGIAYVQHTSQTLGSPNINSDEELFYYSTFNMYYPLTGC